MTFALATARSLGRGGCSGQAMFWVLFLVFNWKRWKQEADQQLSPEAGPADVSRRPANLPALALRGGAPDADLVGGDGEGQAVLDHGTAATDGQGGLLEGGGRLV